MWTASMRRVERSASLCLRTWIFARWVENSTSVKHDSREHASLARMIPSEANPRGGAIRADADGAMLRKALLLCGILSSLLYILMNIVVPMQWSGYSLAGQTVSE